jgi:hypothetical protein
MENARQLSVVVAGDSKITLDERYGTHFWQILAANGFVDRTSVGCVGFCRDLNNNSLIVVLPKAYSSDDFKGEESSSEIKIDKIFRLVRVFNRIFEETTLETNPINTNRTIHKLESNTDPVLDSLEAALKLRIDFIKNGIYYRKVTKYFNNEHKYPINWSKTIKHRVPLLDKESIIFNSTIHNSRKRRIDHPLSQLYISCLCEIFKLTGEKHLLREIPSNQTPLPKQAKINPKQYIRTIGNDVFDERGRYILKLLRSFLGDGKLQNIQSKERDDILSYTSDFENIWEHILRKLFAPDTADRNLPTGRWYDYPLEGHKDGITPSVDGIIRSNGTNAIIDAKDYRVINGSRWGHANDYYKQVIYRILMDAKESGIGFNILAFPSINQGRLFRIKGCHEWSEIGNSRVFEILIDYEIAVKRWLGETHLNLKDELQLLIDELNEFQNKVIAS